MSGHLLRPPSALVLLLLSWPAAAPAQGPDGGASPADGWRQDLKVLVEEVHRHPALFRATGEARFTEAVAALDAALPGLERDQALVRFQQLLVLLEDGHSGLTLRPHGGGDVPDRLPLRLLRLEEGLFVRAAAPEYADLVGGRVVQVGGVDWREAVARVEALVPHDPGNDGPGRAWGAKVLLVWPRLLHGLGLTPSGEEVELVLEKDGARLTRRVRASVPLGAWYLEAVPAGWAEARPRGTPAPLAARHPELPFWLQALPERHAVYVRFNVVQELGGETLEAFARRLEAALARPGVGRVVVDVRSNSGGNNTLLRPLLVTLIRAPQNRRGGLWVLTGPATFSSAQNFCNRLESYAEVIFGGQPTGENVNFFGDPAHLLLPHLGVEASLSALWWQDKDARDRRTATFPELAAVPTWADELAGRDPALELALGPTPATLEEVLVPALGSLPRAEAAHAAYVGDPLHRFQGDPESRVNALGYRLLAERRVAEAVVALTLNTRVHPRSANTHDSLGEALLAAGDVPGALAAYRKAVELDPGNAGAKAVIARLEGAGR